MLTRIEIDGFKSFERFALDLEPFTVILGPNASGKSNLFDAIRLLSQLAATDLRSALKGLRGEPLELFRIQTDGSACQQMSFAVELLLAPHVRDPWGEAVTISHSRVRYEVEIERTQGDRGIDRLRVTRETVNPILATDDRWHSQKRSRSASFSKAFLNYNRKQHFLKTEEAEGKRIFKLAPDGRNNTFKILSAESAETTILSSITSAEFPHLYAVRQELLSWRFLQLDPVALRHPSSRAAPLDLAPDGANLATVLARIQAETATDIQPKGALADIAADLSYLIPSVTDVRVEEDEKYGEYRINIAMREGESFSSRVVSDGTLRLLALLTLLNDPNLRGLICFEEPENGIHPLRLKAAIAKLRELAIDPGAEAIEEGQPLSQILLNSHSPVVLSGLDNGEAVFADMVSVVDPEAPSITRKTRMRPVQFNGTVFGDNRDFVSSYEVKRYLQSVEREV